MGTYFPKTINMKRILFTILLSGIWFLSTAQTTSSLPSGYTPFATQLYYKIASGDTTIVTGATGKGFHVIPTTQSLRDSLAKYVPLTRTLTINGSTQSLSANRTWNVGTVISITPGYGLTPQTAITTSGGFGVDTNVIQTRYDKIVYVQHYGTTEAAIQSAINAASSDGKRGLVILEPGRVYTQINGLINGSSSGNGAVDIQGNGATLKRGNQSTATTTASVNQASTTLTVDAVPSDWVVGNTLQIYDGNSVGNVNISGGSNNAIISIVGNTITLAGAVGVNANTGGAYTWASGSTVRKYYNQITTRRITTPDPIYQVVIDNLIFDGNSSNNTGNYYWGVNRAIENASKINVTVKNSRFFNIPNECIYGSGISIINNRFNNLNGSLLHIGASFTDHDSEWFYSTVSGNVSDSTNLKHIESGHSEAVITFSATSGRYNIYNNYFFNGANLILGNFQVGVSSSDGSTRDFVFSDNLCRNFTNVFGSFSYTSPPYSTQNAGNFVVANNVFDNCGVQAIDPSVSSYDTVFIGNNRLWGGTQINGIPINSKLITDIAIKTPLVTDLAAGSSGVDSVLVYDTVTKEIRSISPTYYATSSSLTGYVTTSQTSPQTIGSTGSRLSKLWATDLAVTNTITGSISGNSATVTTNANLTGAVTSLGNTTSLGSFSSSNLSGALTDETGSGSAVFRTSPTLSGVSLTGNDDQLTIKTTSTGQVGGIFFRDGQNTDKLEIGKAGNNDFFIYSYDYNAGAGGVVLSIEDVTGESTHAAKIIAPSIKLTSGANNGYVLTSDASGNGTWASPASGLVYKGAWDASTNTPTLADGTGTNGWEYSVSVGGTQFGRTFVAGGFAIYNGSIWEPVGTSAAVTSVNGYTGAVTLAKSDVGLGNADNTSDVNKPVSTATQNALDLKANITNATLVTPNIGVATGTSLSLSSSGSSPLTAKRSGGSDKPVYLYSDGTVSGMTNVLDAGANHEGVFYNPSTHTVTVNTNGALAATFEGDGDLVVVGNASAANLSGTNTGDQTNITGNSGTATALQTPRTIAGVSFDGTSNISLNNNAITNGAGYITASSSSALTNKTGAISQWTNDSGYLTTAVTSIASGSGMGFSTITGTGTITMGTPSSVTLSSTNSTSTTSHTHAFSPGGTSAQYVRGDGVLATTPTGTVTSIASGNGMNFSTITGTGTITMGTPSSITSSSTNSTSTTSHTHEITSLPSATTATTQTAGDNSTKVATTAYVDGSYLKLSGGTLTGTLNGTNAIFSGDVTANSDSTLKKNIRHLISVSTSLRVIGAYSYDWKSNNSHAIGLIAQEVQKYYPELVRVDKNGILSLNYQNFTAILLAGWKELDERILKIEQR